jgi:hypothetical protein
VPELSCARTARSALAIANPMGPQDMAVCLSIGPGLHPSRPKSARSPKKKTGPSLQTEGPIPFEAAQEMGAS